MGVSSLLPPIAWVPGVELKWSSRLATVLSDEPFMGPEGDILEGKVGFGGVVHWHTLLTAASELGQGFKLEVARGQAGSPVLSTATTKCRSESSEMAKGCGLRSHFPVTTSSPPKSEGMTYIKP